LIKDANTAGLAPGAWAVLLLAVVMGLAGSLARPLLTRQATYQYFELDESTAVETWAVALPLGYRIVRQKSTPPRPDDGLRVFPGG
jgi:uncharacterized membrane protein YjjP (DUF1212 family)